MNKPSFRIYDIKNKLLRTIVFWFFFPILCICSVFYIIIKELLLAVKFYFIDTYEELGKLYSFVKDVLKKHIANNTWNGE